MGAGAGAPKTTQTTNGGSSKNGGGSPSVMINNSNKKKKNNQYNDDDDDDLKKQQTTTTTTTKDLKTTTTTTSTMTNGDGGGGGTTVNKSTTKEEEFSTISHNNNNNNKTKEIAFGYSCWYNPLNIFGSEKKAYHSIACEFHQYHRHDMNVLLHLFTTGIGIWGVIQLAMTTLNNDNDIHHVHYGTGCVILYTLLIACTTPLITSVLHTIFVLLCCQVIPPESYNIVIGNDNTATSFELSSIMICTLAIIAGYGLQDLAHYICMEPTYMGSYITTKPYLIVIHSIWLMPLVIDAVLMRSCYLPYLVHRNRNIATTIASKNAVDTIRTWVSDNIPHDCPETTHVWPHERDITSKAVVAMENDSSILASFRTLFTTRHYDIQPIQNMNEIYVTAVGAKRDINSDAVFYTPHWDGPYAWIPFASVYRVLVGITPNDMVRTRYNLQHESQDQILDKYGVVGFDYNRELHWIDHVPGKKNTERRSVVKLHYVVYPRGWHWYGQLVSTLNTNYNTWARNNFLRTLRPETFYEYGLAWWIWLTTKGNALMEEYIGWSNLLYIGIVGILSFAMKSTSFFVIMTSFRHYMIYMTTFAYRQPMVAHGYLMRDCKFFKTIALIHLGIRLLPLVQIPRDIPGILLAITGFSITILATIQLGMVRTYFGSELGFVKPQWISGFPYNTIPHPMIVGQLFAYTSIILWWWNDLMGSTTTTMTFNLIVTHMSLYIIHMIQEMLTSSY